MAESVVKVGMSDQDYLALRLDALRRGTTVDALLLSLGREHLAASAQAGAPRTRQATAAAILARAGIDPNGEQHQRISERAAAAVRRRTDSTDSTESTDGAGAAQDGRRGAA